MILARQGLILLLILLIWTFSERSLAETVTPTPSQTALPPPTATPTRYPAVTYTPPPTWTPTAPAPPLITPEPPQINIMQALLDGRFDLTLFDRCSPLSYQSMSPNRETIRIVHDALYRLSDGGRIVAIEQNMQFSPNGQFAYVREARNSWGIYRLSDGVRLLDTRQAMTFSPDDRFVMVSDDFGYRVYSLADGKQLFDTRLQVTFSPNGRWLFLQDQGTLYDSQTLAPVMDQISLLVFSSDSQYVAMDVDSDVGIYRLSDMAQLFRISRIDRRSVFSPDNQFVYDSSSQVIRRMSDGQVMLENVRMVTYSPDNRYVYIQHTSNRVIYALPDFEHLFTVNVFSGFVGGDETQYIYVNGRGESGFYRLPDGTYWLEGGLTSYSPNQQYVVLTDSQDHLILLLHRLTDREQIAQGTSITFSPDDEYVYVTDISGVNRIYRLSDRALILTTPNSLITFAPNNEYVILDDGIYSLPDAQKISNLVMNLQFIPDNDQQALTPCGIAQVNLDADPVILTTNTRANLREKPEYTVLRQVESGLDLIAIGRSADGLWYRVVNPLHPDDRRREFWISASVVNVSGDVDHLLIVE